MSGLSSSVNSQQNPDGFTELLSSMLHHPCAPNWNHIASDDLTDSDLRELEKFSKSLSLQLTKQPSDFSEIPDLDWLESTSRVSPFFRAQLAQISNPESEWCRIPCMSREDLIFKLQQLIPRNSPMEQLRVYKTAGTTGHPIVVPHSRVSVACYQPFLEHALRMAGINLQFSASQVACFLIGAQLRTVTYATTLSYWNDAGFAKINLDPGQWKRKFDPLIYISEFEPLFLTGDPLSFSKLLESELNYSPRALITTAVALSDGLREQLQVKFKCPVIDWYSLTETGPIACKLPSEDAYKIIAPDIYVECLDSDGKPVDQDQIGEITITGGRNPFIPLLRYRTGDFGRLVRTAQATYICDLEGRKPVRFRRSDGSEFSSVEIAIALRPYPIVQYEFIQRKSLDCELILRISNPEQKSWLSTLHQRLHILFAENIRINISLDQDLGLRNRGGKVYPYRSEVLLDE